MGPDPSRKKTALVLSGGGARGAYEVGVLRYIREELPSALGFQPRFDIICGTSVGAVNACFISATAHEPEKQGKRLAEIWESLVLDEMYELGLRDLITIPWNLFRGRTPRSAFDRGRGAPRRLGGILNTAPLETLVLREIPWKNISKNFREGHTYALSVSSTEISSGNTVVFFQHGEKRFPQWARDYHIIPRMTTIGPSHALASAAIPLLFPAVRVGNAYYCDGGLRQNTPLSPALRLGADRVLVIGLKYSPPGPLEMPGKPSGKDLEAYVNPLFILGKVLNALLLDRAEYDLDRLRLFNAVIDGGEKAYGPDFLQRINSIIVPIRGAPYRRVEDLYITPSEDIGAVASRHAGRGKAALRLRGIVSWAFTRISVHGLPRGEADFLSYLMFDGAYAKDLIRLGMADAAAHKDDLVSFFSTF